MRPIWTAPISIQASGLTAQAALVGPRISEDPSIFKAIKTLSETEEKTRNCVETFLPRFPGDLLIDFSSFHMENRYFGISNFPLGPQDGYSAPPGPKILNPSCSLRDPHLCSYPHSSQYSAMFIHCVTVYAFLEAKWDIFFGKSYCLSTHYW